MTRLLLANADYRTHATDEGWQLQEGLRVAGWTLAGADYGDGLADVPALLDRHRPEIVLVHDKRDWDPRSSISFRKDVGFGQVGVLARRPDLFRIAVVKDAATFGSYQGDFVQEVGSDAALVYYGERMVREHAPWLGNLPLIRTWHTVDADLIRAFGLEGPRKRALVTGAVSGAYPVRKAVFDVAASLGIDAIKHPGYGNAMTHTPSYLKLLTGYRVHVATASRYGFALRKIIESVACGATPVTNLPGDDVLPGIDGALVRVSAEASVREVNRAVNRAESEWNLGDRLRWARAALEFYDWRAMGRRNDAAIETARLRRWEKAPQ